tara:strand:- start:477 stop:653 length:177 start_codon:yes stop_codon:yes gene_type:complete
MNKANLTADLIRYYEIDINNCTMTNKQWIAEIVEALTNKEYLNEFNIELNLYNELRNE